MMRVDRVSPPGIALILVFVLLSQVCLSAQQKPDCTVRVTLLQVNDVYQFAPVDLGTRGGIARVLTLKQQIEKQSPNTLFLLAGDTISPSVESITYKGAQMIDAWNAAGLDYATFGNHEFDFGPEVLRQRMKESKFKWIVANVIDKKTGKPFDDAPAYVIREFDGVKVGIFGLTLEETKITSRPGPDVEFLTKRDVLSILPFKNRVVKLELTGATLREVIEHGVARSAEDAEPGRFPQVSGVRFTFDVRRPPGSRTVELTVNGKPLDEKKRYTLATSDYVGIDGGDGYSMLKGARLLIPRAQGPIDSDVLQAAIVAKKVIAPKIDGRIKRLDKDQKQKTDCN